jgi:hypothetical protein
MCGDPVPAELRRLFDPASRCLVVKDLAVRYLGEPGAISDELRAADFRITRWEVEPPRDERGQPLLLAEAVRPTDG